MMQEFFQSLTERLQTSAHVKTVYGEPIVLEGKRVVPVARVAYGFGGGGGKRGTDEDTGSGGADEGGGGGGGCAAVPMGVVEITDGGTRFISFGLTQKLAGAAAAGLLLGVLIGRHQRRA
ncbi:MAG: spore germination protein GerW family protein [Terriglobia bacterium]